MDPSTEETLELLTEAEELKLACQHDDAIDVLERILSDDPENIVALEELAENELALHRFERARIAALQVLHLHDESYIAHYILGFLESRDESWTNAIQELKAANKLHSNNAEILRCLGWALFHKDASVSGIVTLERALNLDSGNPLILCDLAVVYMQSNECGKAHSLFKRALELDPENLRAEAGFRATAPTKRRMKMKIKI